MIILSLGSTFYIYFEIEFTRKRFETKEFIRNFYLRTQQTPEFTDFEPSNTWNIYSMIYKRKKIASQSIYL